MLVGTRPPGTPTVGQCYYDPTYNHIRMWNGKCWEIIVSPSTPMVAVECQCGSPQAAGALCTECGADLWLKALTEDNQEVERLLAES